MGDNIEFEAFRHILSCYTHYSWLIVLDLQRFITVCLWLPLVAKLHWCSNHYLVGDNREFEAFRHILSCYTHLSLWVIIRLPLVLVPHYSWLIVSDPQSFITIYLGLVGESFITKWVIIGNLKLLGIF